jgi:sRNA-binding carbon storage regulator CsrA
MLVLTGKIQESLAVGDDVIVTVTAIDKGDDPV